MRRYNLGSKASNEHKREIIEVSCNECKENFNARMRRNKCPNCGASIVLYGKY